MSLSYEELKKRVAQYEQERADIEAEKARVQKKFQDLVKQHTDPLQNELQTPVNALTALQTKAKSKIKNPSPTDKDMVKKLSILEKKRYAKYAKQIAAIQAKMDEVGNAYQDGLDTKLESLDNKAEKLAKEYEQDIAEFKKMEQLKAVIADPKALVKSIKDLSQALSMDQQSAAYLNDLKNRWQTLNEAIAHIVKANDTRALTDIKEPLEQIEKQLIRQIEDLTIDIQMHMDDANMYPKDSKEQREFKRLASDKQQKMDVLATFATDMKDLQQKMSKQQTIADKPTVAPSVVEVKAKSPEVEKRKSMTSLKAVKDEGLVKRRIAAIEEKIAKEGPQGKGPK